MTRLTNAEYQRAYRERQAALRTRLNTRTEALEQILAHPRAPAAVRQIAKQALENNDA